MYIVYLNNWDLARCVGQERLLVDAWLELAADDVSPLHAGCLYSAFQLLTDLEGVVKDVDRDILNNYHITQLATEILDRLDRETWIERCYPNDLPVLKDRLREVADRAADPAARGQFYSALRAMLQKIGRETVLREQILYISDLVSNPATHFQRIVRATAELTNDLLHFGHSRAHLHRWILRTVVGDDSSTTYRDLFRNAQHLTTAMPRPYRVLFHVFTPPAIANTAQIEFSDAAPPEFHLDANSPLALVAAGRFARVTVAAAFDHTAAVERGTKLLQRYLCSNRFANLDFNRAVSTYCAVKEQAADYTMCISGLRRLTERRLHNDDAFYGLPPDRRNEATFSELDRIIYWLEQSWLSEPIGTLISQWTVLEFLCSTAGKSAPEAIQALVPVYIAPQYPRLLLLDFWRFIVRSRVAIPQPVQQLLGIAGLPPREAESACNLQELFRLAIEPDAVNQILPFIQDYPILVYKWRRVTRLNPGMQAAGANHATVWDDVSELERTVVFNLQTFYRIRNSIVHDAEIDVLQLDRVCQRLNWLLCATVDTILHQFTRNPSLRLTELHDVNSRWYTAWKEKLRDHGHPVNLTEVLNPRVHFLR